MTGIVEPTPTLETPAKEVPIVPVRTSPHNVDRELTKLIGRNEEIRDVKSRVARKMLVTLTGVGGSGKTRLAMEVGLELTADFPDGVRLVELADVPHQSQIVGKFASSLPPSQPARSAQSLDELATLLGNPKMLLIVENCERHIPTCAKVIDGLLRRNSRLHVLATSRERLGPPYEDVVAVRALKVPSDENWLSLDQLQQNESVQLFCEYAQDGVFKFQLDTQNAPHVAEICERVAGIPMFIVLAAARVKFGNSAEEVARGLRDIYRSLTPRKPHCSRQASNRPCFDRLELRATM